MNFFDHKDLGNHLLQLCPKVVKHRVCGLLHTYIRGMHSLSYLRSKLLQHISVLRSSSRRVDLYTIIQKKVIKGEMLNRISHCT